MKKTSPKILLLDIETGPAKAYIWSLFDTYTPLERLIEPGRTLCAAFQWYGEKEVYFVSEWYHGTKAMLGILRRAMSEADAVITYNGDKFDFIKLAGEFILHDVKPCAPITSIDLYKVCKKLGFISGKLEYVGPYLEIGSKTKHAGFSLWRKVLSGDAKAQRKMEAYNRKDVRLMVGLYKLMAPYMENHPSLHGQRCSVCGSAKWHKHGTRKTRAYEYDRLECQTCGHWDKGPKRKIK